MPSAPAIAGRSRALAETTGSEFPEVEGQVVSLPLLKAESALEPGFVLAPNRPLEPVPVRAPDRPAANGSQEPVEITANKIRFETGITHAEGNAHFAGQKTVLRADSIRYDPGKQTLNAQGNVSLTRENNTISGEKLTVTYDLETGRAVVTGAHTTVIRER